MKRLLFAATLGTLTFPASALAARTDGAVLSVDPSHHAIQVVDAAHEVHAYRYHGRLPKLHPGSTIAFQRTGAAIEQVRALSNSSYTVSYYARVERVSSRGVELMLSDGRRLSFSAADLRHRLSDPARHNEPRAHADDVTISDGVAQLRQGEAVLIIETVAPPRHVAITVAPSAPGAQVPPLPASSAGAGGGELQAAGTVTAVASSTLTVQTAEGSTLALQVAPATLASLSLAPCDTVTVSYHQSGRALVADDVQGTGTSSTGNCALGDSQDVDGTITQISEGSLTITTDQGPMSFSADPTQEITDGFLVGDAVDVTYAGDGYGQLWASDVEYYDVDATGTVQAVSASSITIISDDTGQPETFTADPSDAMFDGINVGDWVDITYHLSSNQPVVDAVSDGSGQ
ncbi:MAG: hypothetical protein ABSG43_15165 [Solirubrobacteraceae bacterium]